MSKGLKFMTCNCVLINRIMITCQFAFVPKDLNIYRIRACMVLPMVHLNIGLAQLRAHRALQQEMANGVWQLSHQVPLEVCIPYQIHILLCLYFTKDQFEPKLGSQMSR